MISKRTLFVISIVLLFFSAIQAWPITLKIASPAPKNSDWDFALKEMAAKWTEISNGRVNLRIYSGGIAGDEDDMIRKMELGQLDGAIISGIGLNKINTELIMLSLPLFVQNPGELDYLLEKMGNDFEHLLENEKYNLVGWQILGWVHFFAKKPVHTPDDLMKQKISVTQSDLVLQKVWQSMGFQIIPSTSNEVMIGLQTGRIEAFYAPSILAASNQWFALAPYMTDMPLCPLLAALLITDKAWQKIPEIYREDIKLATREIMIKVIKKTDELEHKAMQVMEENGLKMVMLDQNQKKIWDNLFIKSRSVLVGDDKAISDELYAKAEKLLNEYRSEN